MRSANAAHQSVKDEGGLVVLAGRGEVKVLNPVGSLVYGMMDGEHTQDEMVAAIVEEFGVEESTARADLDAFLEQLQADRMLLGPTEVQENTA